MSLGSLSKRIRRCSREMDRQRNATQRLLDRQRSDIREQLKEIPLPLVMGLGFLCGFIAQRYIHTPAPSHLLRLFATWRGF